MEDTFDLRKYLSEDQLLKEDCGCGCANCKEKSQLQNSPLTLEEQKSVVKMVIESHKGVTLTEAKSNENIREEMILNLKFYNGLKQSMGPINEAALGGTLGAIKWVLSALGNIKDFLTGSGVIKSITDFISKVWNKIKSWINKQYEKFMPQSIKDVSSLTADALKDSIEGFAELLNKGIKWIANTFSYKGMSWLLAAIKYRTFKPSKKQKECMIPLAKKIISFIYKGLVIAFIAKIILIIGLAVAANPYLGVAAGAGWKAYIIPIITKIGGGSGATWLKITKTAGSSLSAVKKGVDAKKYGNEAKKIATALKQEKENEEEKAKSSWDVLWYKCDTNLTSSTKIGPSGEKREKLSGEKMIDYAKALNNSIKGFGTNEDLLFKVLTQISKEDDKTQETIKNYYKVKFDNGLIDDIKGDLSGKDLEKALNLLK